MRDFDAIYEISAGRKGGAKEFESILSSPASAKTLAAIPDDRWLSMMSKCIFQAGFNWKVVQNKWDDIEEVFDHFDIGRMGFMTDEDIGEHLSNPRVIRHGKKIAAIRDNAQFLGELARENGSAARVFAEWPSDDFIGLLAMLKKRATRLGGNSAMYFLRFMGVDSFVLSRDVCAALIREGVVDKSPSSKKDMDKVQAAFNVWSSQSGRPLMQISRVLACSVDN
ncbi:MAG: 3-methyladenine DNA glycosylase [Hyphomicrobiales bacterium]|nr:3-methyladenine DNA glycosylase [Hyphomicrobiales bacterium]MCP4998534.1 3-methyladenine DNA glycosylase [Hyphomicrobiales bacterium]